MKLIDISIADEGLPTPTPEIEQERKVAVFDLLEDNSFTIPRDDAPNGPYKLHLAIRDRRLVFDVKTQSDDPAAEFHLSLSPFRQVVKDYFQICKSYYEAVKTMAPAQIEAIDMGRRGIHNEGARVLSERLEGKVAIDNDTSRRLFTLICVLHSGGA